MSRSFFSLFISTKDYLSASTAGERCRKRIKTILYRQHITLYTISGILTLMVKYIYTQTHRHTDTQRHTHTYRHTATQTHRHTHTHTHHVSKMMSVCLLTIHDRIVQLLYYSARARNTIHHVENTQCFSANSSDMTCTDPRFYMVIKVYFSVSDS